MYRHMQSEPEQPWAHGTLALGTLALGPTCRVSRGWPLMLWQVLLGAGAAEEQAAMEARQAIRHCNEDRGVSMVFSYLLAGTGGGPTLPGQGPHPLPFGPTVPRHQQSDGGCCRARADVADGMVHLSLMVMSS